MNYFHNMTLKAKHDVNNNTRDDLALEKEILHNNTRDDLDPEKEIFLQGSVEKGKWKI